MDIIKNDEIIDSLKRSGYLLENRILNIFSKFKFWSETNHPFFINTDENKYREVDVVATKHITSFDIKINESISLYVHFIVECINNPQPLGLFENLGDTDEPASDWIYEITNGTDLLKETVSLDLPYIIHRYEEESYNYLASRQYCGFTKKKGNQKNPWMANHPDDFHKTLTKLVDAVKYKRIEIKNRWNGIQPTMGRLDFIVPAIVLQGEMIKIIQKNDLDIIQTDFHRLKTPYDEIINKNISLDIVKEIYFEKYLKNKIDGLLIIFENLKKEIKKNYA